MLEIRPAETNDHPRIAEILSACYRWLGEHAGLTDGQVAWLVEERASLASIEAERVEHVYLVACERGRAVGVVAYKDAQIVRLYVEPPCHRRGIGRALFEAAERGIQVAGFDAVELGSLVEDAVPFYEAMGMSVVGHKDIQKGPWAGHRVALMRKALQGSMTTDGRGRE